MEATRLEDTIFADQQALNEGFKAGLGNIIEAGKLPGIILVAATLSHYPELKTTFRSKLEDALAKLFQDEKIKTLLMQDPAKDDENVAILRKLKEFGLVCLGETKFRMVGPYALQYNSVRASRPIGMAGEPVTSIYAPTDFEKSKFHFDKPFVQIECFAEGLLRDLEVSIFFQKWPFAGITEPGLHFILVPERKKHHIQFLFPDHHEWMWEVCEFLGSKPGFEGILFGYNPPGACGSVPQLHFQGIIQPDGCPVADSRWSHNSDGGIEEYSLPCEVYSNHKDAWEWIEDKFRSNKTYNLLYAPGKNYCFERRFQGTYSLPQYFGDIAFYECHGGFTTSNEDIFQAATIRQLTYMHAIVRTK